MAKEDGILIGYIMLTKTCVATGSLKFEALLLAPLAVTLEYRRYGIGSKLVRKSFELAKNLGYRAVFVVGDPDFYRRFSFKSSAPFGIRHIPTISDQFVMVNMLSIGALNGITGTITLT